MKQWQALKSHFQIDHLFSGTLDTKSISGGLLLGRKRRGGRSQQKCELGKAENISPW